MGLSKWVFGAVAAGLWLGSAQAAPLPVAKAPAAGLEELETVQYYYGPPPGAYYGPPPRRYYGPPRGYYGRPYYAPRPAYGYGRGYGYGRPAYDPPRYYTKDQVRAWNRMHGF